MQLSFLLVKGGIILLNDKGFTLLEVIVASTIIMMVVTTIIPISSLLEQQKMILSERRAHSSMLHDELQAILWNNEQLPQRFTNKIQFIDVNFYFTAEGEYVKGCAKWKNAKGKSETICLYGYR